MRNFLRKRNPLPPQMELNVTSLVDIMTVLLVFLLMTAVFAQSVVIDISLPEAGPSNQTALLQDQPPPEEIHFVMINLTKDRVHLATDKKIYPPVTIPSWEGEPDLTILMGQLQEVVAEYPTQRDVVLIAPDDAPYSFLIHVMDACIGIGLTNVSLASPQMAPAGLENQGDNK